MKPLSASLLKNVENLLNQGKSSRAIAQTLGISKSIVNKKRPELATPAKTPKSGAPQKLSPREKQDLVIAYKRGKVKTAVEATKLINSTLENPVSCDTVRRAFKELGYYAKKKTKKPKLIKRHRLKRNQWACEHMDWTIDDWKRVIFSDEVKFNLICSDGVQYAWIPKNDRFNENGITPTVKFGGGSVMIWGCMTWFGPGLIIKVEGKMNADQYISILRRGLIPTLEASNLIPGFPLQKDLIFQQDNDPKHTSAKAKQFFRDLNITVMDCSHQI